MSVIKINNEAIPDPSKIAITKQDLDSPDTTRNELGYLQRDRIRAGVYKVSLSYNAKTGSDITAVETAISGASFDVTFPDSSGDVTKTMYVGDRSKELVQTTSGFMWTLNFDLVEY